MGPRSKPFLHSFLLVDVVGGFTLTLICPMALYQKRWLCTHFSFWLNPFHVLFFLNKSAFNSTFRLRVYQSRVLLWFVCYIDFLCFFLSLLNMFMVTDKNTKPLKLVFRHFCVFLFRMSWNVTCWPSKGNIWNHSVVLRVFFLSFVFFTMCCDRWRWRFINAVKIIQK